MKGTTQKEQNLSQPSCIVTKSDTFPLFLSKLSESNFGISGNCKLTSFFLEFLFIFSIKAKITFLPPINGKDFTNRKDMTYTLHNAIDNFYSNEFNNSLPN